MKTKYTFFSYLGGPGGPLRRTQVNENFRAVRPHHRADISITREKNNRQFFIYGPLYTKMCIFGYSTSQLSSHLYQSTYKIWKQSDKVFLSYRVNDEMRMQTRTRTRTRRLNDD